MTETHRIGAAIFDMGNVLVRFSHDRMHRQLAAATGLTPSAVAAALAEGDMFREFDRGTVSPAEFVARLESRAGRKLDPHAVGLAASDIFEPMPESEKLLAELRGLGLRLVMLSNTCAPHVAWVRQRFRFLDEFDALVLSYEVGAVKPEPAIFRAAIEAAGCPPERCFYTDDIPEYIAAARALGMDGEVFVGAKECREHLRMRGVEFAIRNHA